MLLRQSLFLSNFSLKRILEIAASGATRNLALKGERGDCKLAVHPVFSPLARKAWDYVLCDGYKIRISKICQC